MLSQILVDSQEEGMSEGPWTMKSRYVTEIVNDYNRIGPTMVSS